MKTAIVNDWCIDLHATVAEIAARHGVTEEVAQAEIDAYMVETTDYYAV